MLKKYLFFLLLTGLLFCGAACKQKSSSQLSQNEFVFKVDSIIVYRLGTGTYTDIDGEINLSTTVNRPIGFELKEIVQENLVVATIRDSNTLHSMYKTLILGFENKKKYTSGTDNRLAIVFFNSDKTKDTLSIINNKQALLNNNYLMIYENNIVAFIISKGIFIPPSVILKNT